MFHIQNILILSQFLPEIKLAFGTLMVVLFVKSTYFNYITNTIKNQVTTLSFNICYYSFYMHAVCSIKFNKYIGVYFTDSPKQIKFTVPQKQYNTLEFYNESFRSVKIEFAADNTLLSYDVDEDEDVNCYKLFIFTDKNNNETRCFNKIVFNTMPLSLEYTPSNINFISIELYYNNKSYPICLKNRQYNYYMVNNRLNSNFFRYYLTNVNCETTLDDLSDNFEYKLIILDGNVNVIELTHKQYVLFLENDYTIGDEPQDDIIHTLKTDITNNENNDFINVEISVNDTFDNYYTQVE